MDSLGSNIYIREEFDVANGNQSDKKIGEIFGLDLRAGLSPTHPNVPSQVELQCMPRWLRSN